MIKLGEEKIEKEEERVTEVPLLIAIWIKLDRTSIDRHPTRKKTINKTNIRNMALIPIAGASY